LLRCISQIIKDDDNIASSAGKNKDLSWNASEISRNQGVLTNEKLLRFLHMTQSDIYSCMQSDCKLPIDDNKLVRQFMKSKLIQIVLKTVLNSIMMAVMSKK